MTGIFIGPEIVATNGHVLTWKKTSGVVNDPFIMPQIPVCLLENSRHVIYKDAGCKWIKLQPENTTDFFIFKTIDEKYPNYKAVIPEDVGYNFKISPKLLLNNLDLADLAANVNTHQAIFSFDENNLFIRSEDFTDLLPVKYSRVPPFEIGFNSRLMQQLLKEKIKNESIEIKLAAPNKAIVIDDEALLMPVTLGNYLDNE